MKKLFVFISLILFLALFFANAYFTRHKLFEKYNEGVQYYENGDYVEAMGVFKNLFGWGNSVDILPEDYYKMAVDHLLDENANIKICPNCGEIIE